MPRNSCSLLFAAMLLLLGCEVPAPDATQAPDVPRPVLSTQADSIAMRVYDAFGGPAAMASMAYLRYDFGSEREGTTRPPLKHLWNRMNGDYRLEMPGGEDSTYVILFNVNTREGAAYLNGAPLDTAQTAQRLEQAYGRFINDMYWLLAPTKLFDPGVQRTYVPDSSDATTDVLHLAFDQVGLTPGDQYWLYIDKESGLLKQWAYLLQSGREGRYTWTGYEDHTVPAGTLHLATRKEALGGDFAILTNHLEMPSEVPADLFTDPNPRL